MIMYAINLLTQQIIVYNIERCQSCRENSELQLNLGWTI